MRAKKIKKSKELIKKEKEAEAKILLEVKLIAKTIYEESDEAFSKTSCMNMAHKIHSSFKNEYLPRIIKGITNGYAGRNGEAYGKVNRTRIGIWIQFEIDQFNKKPY